MLLADVPHIHAGNLLWIQGFLALLGFPVGLVGVGGSRSGFAAPGLEWDVPGGSVSDPGGCWTLPLKSWLTLEHGRILELLPSSKLSTKLKCSSGRGPD